MADVDTTPSVDPAATQPQVRILRNQWLKVESQILRVIILLTHSIEFLLIGWWRWRLGIRSHQEEEEEEGEEEYDTSITDWNTKIACRG